MAIRLPQPKVGKCPKVNEGPVEDVFLFIAEDGVGKSGKYRWKIEDSKTLNVHDFNC